MEGIHVLLVDPNDASRGATIKQLRQCNYKVVSVGCAEGALSILKEETHAIQLILTEVELPDMDGFEFLRAVGSISKLPIIVSTCMDDRSTQMRALACGAYLCLGKPVRLNDARKLWVPVFPNDRHVVVDSQQAHEPRQKHLMHGSNNRLKELKRRKMDTMGAYLEQSGPVLEKTSLAKDRRKIVSEHQSGGIPGSSKQQVSAHMQGIQVVREPGQQYEGQNSFPARQQLASAFACYRQGNLESQPSPNHLLNPVPATGSSEKLPCLESQRKLSTTSHARGSDDLGLSSAHPYSALDKVAQPQFSAPARQELASSSVCDKQQTQQSQPPPNQLENFIPNIGSSQKLPWLQSQRQLSIRSHASSSNDSGLSSPNPCSAFRSWDKAAQPQISVPESQGLASVSACDKQRNLQSQPPPDQLGYPIPTTGSVEQLPSLQFQRQLSTTSHARGSNDSGLSSTHPRSAFRIWSKAAQPQSSVSEKQGLSSASASACDKQGNIESQLAPNQFVNSISTTGGSEKFPCLQSERKLSTTSHSKGSDDLRLSSSRPLSAFRAWNKSAQPQRPASEMLAKSYVNSESSASCQVLTLYTPQPEACKNKELKLFPEYPCLKEPSASSDKCQTGEDGLLQQAPFTSQPPCQFAGKPLPLLVATEHGNQRLYLGPVDEIQPGDCILSEDDVWSEKFFDAVRKASSKQQLVLAGLLFKPPR